MTNWIFDRYIKEAVGADDPDFTEDNAKIALINKVVTQTLENLLGRSLTKQTYTEKFTSRINQKLYWDIYGSSWGGFGTVFKPVTYNLRHFPVDPNTIVVTLFPNYVVDGEVILEATDYVLNPETGELVITKPIGSSFWEGLSVTYDAGYEATQDQDLGEGATAEEALAYNIPADLVQAAIYQAMHVYEKQKFSNINVRESRSQGTTNFSRYVNIHAIAPEAMAIVMQHKRFRIRVV